MITEVQDLELQELDQKNTVRNMKHLKIQHLSNNPKIQQL